MSLVANRTYRFPDGNKLINSQVDKEIQGIYDLLYQLDSGITSITNLVFVAPDNRKFKLSVGYEIDGVTPKLVLQEVFFP